MAGSKSATRIPMIAITTSSSTSVNARLKADRTMPMREREANSILRIDDSFATLATSTSRQFRIVQITIDVSRSTTRGTIKYRLGDPRSIS
jgi:hypothetical protein